MRTNRISAIGCVLALGVGATAASSATAPTTLSKGSFAGVGKYTGSGSVSAVRSGTRRTIKLASNFRADRRSIRLRLYLATDPAGRNHVDLGAMTKSGAQSFRVPSSVKLANYRYVFAWCAAVDEPIARARLR